MYIKFSKIYFIKIIVFSQIKFKKNNFIQNHLENYLTILVIVLILNFIFPVRFSIKYKLLKGNIFF